MRFSAAVIPPQSALDELADVVHSVGGATHELDAVSPLSMRVPITSFGNVAQREAVALRDALRREAAQWPQPRLRFAGGTALEWPGDESVWARLDGDVDQLTAIGRGVPTVVRPLGFFVDRRQFRPWLAVGQITASTTAPYLQRLVDALDELKGQLWTLTELCLLHRLPKGADEAEDRVEIFDRFPLAAD
jgi:2'-5' RNA ligase